MGERINRHSRSNRRIATDAAAGSKKRRTEVVLASREKRAPRRDRRRKHLSVSPPSVPFSLPLVPTSPFAALINRCLVLRPRPRSSAVHDPPFSERRAIPVFISTYAIRRSHDVCTHRQPGAASRARTCRAFLGKAPSSALYRCARSQISFKRHGQSSFAITVREFN